jgi:flagellar hook-length control protein FliK
VSDTNAPATPATAPATPATAPKVSDTNAPATPAPAPKVSDTNAPAVPATAPKVSDTNAPAQTQRETKTEEADGIGIPQTIPLPIEALHVNTTTTAVPVTSVLLEIDPASATARTQELVEAANAVADTIFVTPSLVKGEGEITIRLKPTVLDGSEIRIEAKGQAISVSLTPATVEVQRLAEQSQARFASTLSERLPSFQIAVAINPRTSFRKDFRDETT